MEGFGSRFIHDIFGIPLSALHYWDRTGLIKPSLRPAAGRGSKRLYSFRDLVQLLVVSRLRKVGISLQRTRKCLAYLRAHFPAVAAPLAELSLITDGDTIFMLTGDREQLLDLIREQVVWSVPVSDLTKSAREIIESATAPRLEKIVVDGAEHTVTVEREPEDGWWIGFVEDLPGCASQGRTREELWDMLDDAIRLYLAMEDNRPTHTHPALAQATAL
jgi:DNA-binding transcriptional MerR regulator